MKKSQRDTYIAILTGGSTALSIPLAVAIGNYWIILIGVLIGVFLSAVLFLATRSAE